jgi:hypothetical protein
MRLPLAACVCWCGTYLHIKTNPSCRPLSNLVTRAFINLFIPPHHL